MQRTASYGFKHGDLSQSGCLDFASPYNFALPDSGKAQETEKPLRGLR